LNKPNLMHNNRNTSQAYDN